MHFLESIHPVVGSIKNISVSLDQISTVCCIARFHLPTRLFPNSGAFFPKFRKRNAKKVRHFREVFFRPRGRFVAFPSQSRLVVGHIRKNGQKFSDLNFRKI